MEKQQWPLKLQQSVAMGLERTEDNLNNGISDKPLENVDGNDGEAGSDPAEKNVNGTCNKNVKIQQIVEAAISDGSRQIIQTILEQVKQLSKPEKLLLYLKLPTECSNTVDPLRQPLNPLGSRAEIHKTISWIKTHLEEDPDISLPKQDVYDEYSAYCGGNNIKPLSQADFGKVMKQVYPKVRARRLGTRGKSRYCYSGLRRRHKLEAPTLPDLSDKPLSTEAPCSQADLAAAAWVIVKEWSERELGGQFSSLQALAYYLVLHLSVSSGSAAAALITSAGENQLKDDLLQSTALCTSRHRETQLQLQRKIQQRNEVSREQKRKLQLPLSKSESKSRSKRAKLQQTSQSSASTSTSPIVATNETNNNTSPPQGLQPVCDKSLDFTTTNLQTLPDFSSFQKPASGDVKPAAPAAAAVADKCDFVTVKDNEVRDVQPRPNQSGKVPIPRLSAGQGKALAQLSPKSTKNVKYKAIQPKPELCDIAPYNPQLTLGGAAENNRSQDVNNVSKSRKQRRKKEVDVKSEVVSTIETEPPIIPLSRERLESVSNVDKDAMDEYLGTNNSQEHEEELLRYFKNNNQESVEYSHKLSQLRQLLQHNIQDNRKIDQNQQNNMGNVSKTGTYISAIPSRQVPPNLPVNSNVRRRVSFETPAHEEAVPPSPNTRRKNFSFTPISPGPLSPNGRQSKCSSTEASPFVSPRNTPIPRVRNNTHQNAGIMYANTQVARKQLKSKVKQELDLNIDEINVKNYNLPMSAPPSPMLQSKSKTSFLQNLLNSNNKIPYTPDYSQTQPAQTVHDLLSNEVSQLFSNEMQQHPPDLSYRSQSVPLNQTNNFDPNYPPTQFPFTINSDQNINEFNDLETFPENTNINMNKIINDLEEQQNEGEILGGDMDVFGNIDLNNIPVPVESEGFVQNPASGACNVRGLNRSHSIDVDMGGLGGTLKFNPSRSVPSTPVPYAKVKLEPIKNFPGQNSRSYPSTPLVVASDTFNYNPGQDYLLNGQPIKEKLPVNIDLQQDIMMTNDEVAVYNDFYRDVGGLNNDVLIDNKSNFNFEGQLTEGGFGGAKQNGGSMLECVLMDNEQGFNDSNVSGS